MNLSNIIWRPRTNSNQTSCCKKETIWQHFKPIGSCPNFNRMVLTWMFRDDGIIIILLYLSQSTRRFALIVSTQCRTCTELSMNQISVYNVVYVMSMCSLTFIIVHSLYVVWLQIDMSNMNYYQSSWKLSCISDRQFDTWLWIDSFLPLNLRFDSIWLNNLILSAFQDSFKL